MAAVDIQFPGNIAQVGSAADLRALPSYMIEAGTLYIITGLGRAFRYDSGSVAVDDGMNVIKPNDRTTLQAGRWLYEMDGFAPGPPGAANNTYRSYAALQASDPTRVYAYLANDTDSPPRADGVYVNLTGAAGEWFRPDDQVSVGFAAAVPTTDGTGPDMAPAIRAAIQMAAASGTSVVTLPGRSGFIYRCNSAIWDTRIHGPFPRNLRFQGLARNPSGYVGGPTIRYTGAAELFFLNFNTGNDECGNYAFSNLTFETTNGAGTLFDWNNTTAYTPGDGDSVAYIRNVSFHNVTMFGAQAGASQTGDGLRGAKLFHLYFDQNCYVRSFRYGVWTKGCDNYIFDGRTNYCGQNLRHEGALPFSSGGQIRAAWIGETVEAGGVPRYPIYDTALGTKYIGNLVEQITPGAAEALIYLGGVGTQLIGWGGAGAPMFRLAPLARDITWIMPNVPQNTAYAPIVDAADSYDFGNPQKQFYMKVFGADLKTQETLGVHPRIIHYNQAQGQESMPLVENLMEDANGVRPASVSINALRYWGKSEGTPFGGGVQLVTDSGALSNRAIRLVNGVVNSGFVMSVVIGRHILNERIALRLRARVTAGSGYGYTVARNGTLTVLQGATFSGGYTTQDIILDLSSYALGDRVEIGIGAVGTVSGDLFVSSAILLPVSNNIADIAVIDGGTSLADLITFINNNYRTALNAHSAVERRFGRIA